MELMIHIYTGDKYTIYKKKKKNTEKSCHEI